MTAQSIELSNNSKKSLLVILGYVSAQGEKYKFRRNNLVVIDGQNSQKDVKKIVNSVRPKGDIELKNITYRISDKRYIGRKQIKGHIITVYARTQKECYDLLKKKIEKVLSHGFKKNNDSNKYLFKDLYMEWYHFEKERFIKDGAKKDILLAFRKLEPFHNLSIKSIKKEDLMKYFFDMEDNRSKEKTHLYLKAFFNYYLNEGVISINPCANIKIIKSYKSKPAFSYEEQKLILEKLEGNPLKVIILLYLITGLRKKELNFESIEKDIDFDNMLLKAENLKGRNFVKRYKQIKLSKKAISLIMNNLDIIHSYNELRAYREFYTFLKGIGINDRSIVNCRHTFATNCFYLGKPELIISREMGHSRSQITKDIYMDVDYHLTKEKIHKLYNNLYCEI